MLPPKEGAVLEDFLNKMFIVKAPISLRDVNEDDYYDTRVDGKWVKQDLDEYVVFGMLLPEIAHNVSLGHTIYMNDSRDIVKLYDTLESFIFFMESLKGRMNISIGDKMEPAILSMTTLANDVFKYNKTRINKDDFSISKVMDNIGFVSTKELEKKLKDKQSKRREKNKVPRFKRNL